MLADNRARILMCAPAHFEVAYSINPWMDPERWARERARLGAAPKREWTRLHDTLRRLGAVIELVPSAPGLPDLVFTANAAVVLDRTALLARFRHPERAGEEPLFEAAFRALQSRGVIDQMRKLPEGVRLEGAGDCVHDAHRDLFWLGYGPRSDAKAAPVVADMFGIETIALELVDPRFYHMDTALCALPRGEIMYVPEAFSDEGRARIAERVASSDRIELSARDAGRLAANAVVLGDDVVMSECSRGLRDRLAKHGYVVHTSPLKSFLRSGGSAFCLTLRLDRKSRQSGAARKSAVA